MGVMDISGWTKLVVCLGALVAAIVLGVTGVIDGSSCTGILMGVLGYVFGNGHGILSAKRNEQERC
jgi:hypothetical protein